VHGSMKGQRFNATCKRKHKGSPPSQQSFRCLLSLCLILEPPGIAAASGMLGDSRFRENGMTGSGRELTLTAGSSLNDYPVTGLSVPLLPKPQGHSEK
jgi:hypothetical protein